MSAEEVRRLHPTAIPMKQWRIQQAIKHKVCESSIHYRINHSKSNRYPTLNLIRLNPRVVFVIP